MVPRVRRYGRALLTLALAATVFACSPKATPGEDRGDGVEESTSAPNGDSSEESSRGGEMVPRPGLYKSGGGRARALGVLDYRELEGGFWAVVDAARERDADSAKVLVVISNAKEFEADVKRLEGQFVEVEGVVVDGISIRQAGPEMDVESIEGVRDAPVDAE